MPRLSAFTPCGQWQLSSTKAPAQAFYEALFSLYGGDRGPLDLTPGTQAEAEMYAEAMVLARAKLEIDRAQNQGDPRRVYDLLPLKELDYLLVPGPLDTLPQRRAALAARMQLALGARASAVVAGLRAILGSQFLAYATSNEYGHPTTYPAPSGLGSSQANMVDERLPPRLVKIIDPMASTPGAGAVWVAYTNVDPTAPAQVLYPGEYVVVDGGNTTQAERVHVLATATQPPAGSNASAATLPAGTTTWAASTTYAPGSCVTPTTANANGFYFYTAQGGTSSGTEPTWPSAVGQTVTDGNVTWVAAGASFCFQANFFKSHDPGAQVFAGNFPYWWSTRRYAWIVVNGPTTGGQALAPATRAKVDDFMRRAARGVSQWGVIYPNSFTNTYPGGTGTVGPVAENSPMSTSTITAYSYPNSN